ncbi:putative nucleotidyltransferase substrate binding domain-containing protein [Albimonas sp. CAU 1670]|uniref:putative nucleotidyltransferase substrate binding domain-containing protein n=1 Tax=Albimonas sp. CAU 1670 TaxID=3032599 RepID=UPI0023D993DA|nr:putative nucleotidyltransferase substrate binding domain-containing protein [Albimonas sp. CAU 1670]MDF2234986.1 putative nucleotidyltransferase substrate binding domain-containing protein [Albimonas sp. CAU 1670]
MSEQTPTGQEAPQGRLVDRLARFAPFDLLPPDRLVELDRDLRLRGLRPGEDLFLEGQPLDGLYVILSGEIEVYARGGEVVSHRGEGEAMGERGLLRDGRAMLSARAETEAELLLLPARAFLRLMDAEPAVARWFGRSLAPEPGAMDDGPYAAGLTALQVRDLMASTPLTAPPEATAAEVARIMRGARVSSVLVMEGARLAGIVTVHDLSDKVLAEGLGGEVPVGRIMTPDPVTIDPEATGLDAMVAMAGRAFNHLPVVERSGRVAGMIARTDLFRRQAAAASHMAGELVDAPDAEAMAEVFERLPELLGVLVAAGARPAAICRRITDLADAATRRLLQLAEARLGPPPVPYLWAACGSQGRREQTGVSDQDNCLILDDAATPAHDAYFQALASFVSDGLNRAGFVYCPGEMMATSDRWRQPRRVWRSYFAQWIREPDDMAQMLASVMFDLRPVAGEMSLFADLHAETLAMARANTIFVRHMIGNALKHAPPLTLFRGLSVIRSGAHRNTLDLKIAGVVPIVDLARIYALRGGIEAVNTRERIVAARDLGVISRAGAHDLLDAYDLIAETRLRHQAAQIARGAAPDNYLAPDGLSDLERSHLRDAFLVVKTMQSAL